MGRLGVHAQGRREAWPPILERTTARARGCKLVASEERKSRLKPLPPLLAVHQGARAPGSSESSPRRRTDASNQAKEAPHARKLGEQSLTAARADAGGIGCLKWPTGPPAKAATADPSGEARCQEDGPAEIPEVLPKDRNAMGYHSSYGGARRNQPNVLGGYRA